MFAKLLHANPDKDWVYEVYVTDNNLDASGLVGTGAVGGTAGNTATTAKKAVQEKQKEKSFLDSLRENVPGFDGYVQIVTDALPDFTNINSVANFRASDLKNVPDRLGNRAKWQGTGFVEETAKEERRRKVVTLKKVVKEEKDKKPLR